MRYLNTMRTIEEDTPFWIPANLREFIQEHLMEYGAGGGIGDILPARSVWRLEDEDGIVVGYAWTAVLLINGSEELQVTEASATAVNVGTLYAERIS